MQHHPQPQHSLTTKGIKSLHVADAYEEAYEDGEEPLKHIHPAHRMQHHLERQQSLTTKGIKNRQASPRNSKTRCKRKKRLNERDKIKNEPETEHEFFLLDLF